MHQGLTMLEVFEEANAIDPEVFYAHRLLQRKKVKRVSSMLTLIKSVCFISPRNSTILKPKAGQRTWKRGKRTFCLLLLGLHRSELKQLSSPVRPSGCLL
jgi:hypothetical protein